MSSVAVNVATHKVKKNNYSGCKPIFTNIYSVKFNGSCLLPV